MHKKTLEKIVRENTVNGGVVLGGHELVFLLADGAWLCFKCLIANQNIILDDEPEEEWRVEGVTTTEDFENGECCDCCGKFLDLIN